MARNAGPMRRFCRVERAARLPTRLFRMVGDRWARVIGPVLWPARARRCPLFLSPKGEWSAGRRQGLARPLWPALAIGQSARRLSRTGLRGPPPGARTANAAGLRGLPPGCCASRRSIRPGPHEARPRYTGCLPAHRTAAGPPPPRDREGLEADFGYIFL